LTSFARVFGPEKKEETTFATKVTKSTKRRKPRIKVHGECLILNSHFTSFLCALCLPGVASAKPGDLCGKILFQNSGIVLPSRGPKPFQTLGPKDSPRTWRPNACCQLPASQTLAATLFQFQTSSPALNRPRGGHIVPLYSWGWPARLSGARHAKERFPFCRQCLRNPSPGFPRFPSTSSGQAASGSLKLTSPRLFNLRVFPLSSIALLSGGDMIDYKGIRQEDSRRVFQRSSNVPL